MWVCAVPWECLKSPVTVWRPVLWKQLRNDQDSSGIIRYSDDPFWVAPNTYIINGLPWLPKMQNSHRRIVEILVVLSIWGPNRGKDAKWLVFHNVYTAFWTRLCTFAKQCFPNGFPWFLHIVRRYKKTVKILMVLIISHLLANTLSECMINDKVYKGLTNVFCVHRK